MKERDENRLIRRLRRAVEAYIARGTEPMDWMHFQHDGYRNTVARWPSARVPEYLEELERYLREFLPNRVVYLGFSMVCEKQRKKMQDIVDVLRKEGGEEHENA